MLRGGVAVEHLLVKFGVNLHCILFYKLAGRCVIAGRAYVLDFGEELAKEAAQGFVVVDLYVGLTVFLYEFDHIVGLAMLICPLGDEFAVAHVCFFYILAGLDAHQLSHHTVEDIFVVLGLVSVGVVEQTDFK